MSYESSRLLLPPQRQATKSNRKGHLKPPDQILFAIRQLYLPLYEWLCEIEGDRPHPSHSPSMKKLQQLDHKQLLELMTDASDGESSIKCRFEERFSS